MASNSLIRWSSEAMHTDVKAAASLSGVSVNTYVENAVAERMARDSAGASPTEAYKTITSTYNSAPTTYRSLSDSGLGHDSIIRQLGGSPSEGESQ